jgi:hypothetical protein
MIRRYLLTGLASLLPLALALGCGNDAGKAFDENGDNIADDLGKAVDGNGDGAADTIDINGDGIPDGPGIDTDKDGVADSLGLDTDCDGTIDSVDTNLDGSADWETSIRPPADPPPGCMGPIVGGTGGTTGVGGTTGTGGDVVGSGGIVAGTGAVAATGGGPSGLGGASYTGTGNTTDRYAESDVRRNNIGYRFMANGWGSNWQSHQISWNGTSFTVGSLNGSQGSDYSPAGYPTVFCGKYSSQAQSGAPSCGLPAAISSLATVKTGWRWKANGNNGQYNAAWDIWLGSGGNLSSYLMVWLRDPGGQQPAGAATAANATVAGLPGTWTIWTGNVNGRPIVNYVRAEGQDLSELEFDVMAVYNDAKNRGYNLPGDQMLAVAVGFEIWNGPVTNLVSEDFYVDVN